MCRKLADLVCQQVIGGESQSRNRFAVLISRGGSTPGVACAIRIEKGVCLAIAVMVVSDHVASVVDRDRVGVGGAGRVDGDGVAFRIKKDVLLVIAVVVESD